MNGKTPCRRDGSSHGSHDAPASAPSQPLAVAEISSSRSEKKLRPSSFLHANFSTRPCFLQTNTLRNSSNVSCIYRSPIRSLHLLIPSLADRHPVLFHQRRFPQVSYDLRRVDRELYAHSTFVSFHHTCSRRRGARASCASPTCSW